MLSLVLALLFQAGPTVKVIDPWGLPVPGVQVTAGNFKGITGETGEVSLPDGLPAEFRVEAESLGFERASVTGRPAAGPIEIRLHVAGVTGRVTVTATRTERLAAETGASTIVVDAGAIQQSPSRAVDDVLRQVPGFSLLRRTGSVAAHPTAQGVSLRGVGATGASRTLVLADGVPLNDAFGSWVYWNRVPKLSVDSIEVLRGGASDLYGTAALGGVIHLRTRRPTRQTLAAEAFLGQRGTGQFSMYWGNTVGPWGYSFSAETFDTDGYFAVADGERGRVDEPIASKYRTANVYLERTMGTGTRLFSSLVVSGEKRRNGTPLLRNDTSMRQATIGGQFSTDRLRGEIRVFGGSQGFDSTFTAIAAGRVSESLASIQAVPLGYGGFQGHTVFSSRRNILVAGAEFRRARGISNELAYRNNAISGQSRNGGSQQILALFLEDAIEITPDINVTASLRWDRWRNEDLSGSTVIRSNTSPRFSLSWRARPGWTLYTSAYGSFRAPTLNELYRPFRVGNVLTNANANLGPERLRGLEGGVHTQALDGRIHVRANGYWSEIRGTVANLTLSTTPALITRQRANLGTAGARGLELDAEFRPLRDWDVSAGYLLSDSTVLSFPSQRVLEGLVLPQVPRHQFSFTSQARFPQDFRLNVQARSSGEQFDDDRNTFRLAGYFSVDTLVSKGVGQHAELFVAAENLFGERIEVGKTPVTTVGQPRTVRGGIQFRWGPRQ